MSNVKVARKSDTKKCVPVHVVVASGTAKNNAKLVVPKTIANRLTATNTTKVNSEAIKQDLDKAKERRQSIQSDRTEKLRKHLERVEKLAQMKRQQNHISEETEEEKGKTV